MVAPFDHHVSRLGPPWCPICCGRSCFGGGNLNCLQRKPWPSVLAGILDTYGGLRFVVTRRRWLKHHVRHDELLVVVPNLKVHEPIYWHDMPGVVARIEREVDLWIKRRGVPNDPVAREAVTMYRLRCLESQRKSLHLPDIAYT